MKLTAWTLAFFCVTALGPQAACAQLELRNPLGFAPLELDNRNGMYVALAALGVSLLLSDGGEEGGDRGKWFVQTQAGYFRSYHDDPTDVFSGRVGFGFYVRDWLAVGIEFHATRLKDTRLEGGGTDAIGGMPFVRWHLLTKGPWTTYFDYGFGMIFTKDDFPPGGTDANFTPTYGVGFGYRVSPRAYLSLGARHWHISNGGVIAGPDRNPGFDSNGVYVGYQLQF